MMVSESGRRASPELAIRDMQACLDRLGDSVSCDPLDPDEVRLMLQRLRASMERCFALAAERHRELLKRSPDCQPDVASSSDQQACLLRTVSAIEATCERHPLHLRTRVAELAEQLLEHDVAETQLRTQWPADAKCGD